MLLPDRTACGTISDIRARKLERPPAIVAAAGVELCGKVREGQQMPSKKVIEAKPCGIELSLGLFELALRNQHIGKTSGSLLESAGKSNASASPVRP
jgi:hypothetical protein